MPFFFKNTISLLYSILMNEFITVRSLLEDNKKRLKLKLICSVNGLNKKIISAELHRPGLALAGFTDTFTHNRIQLLGNTEISYLSNMPEEQLRKSIDKVMEFEIPVIIVTSKNKIPKYLVQAATRRYVPIISSPFQTTEFMLLLGDYLQNTFAAKT